MKRIKKKYIISQIKLNNDNNITLHNQSIIKFN
jgi:hypothetical protein